MTFIKGRVYTKNYIGSWKAQLTRSYDLIGVWNITSSLTFLVIRGGLRATAVSCQEISYLLWFIYRIYAIFVRTGRNGPMVIEGPGPEP